MKKRRIKSKQQIDVKRLTPIVYAVAKKYAHSVRKCEWEDLIQTIWYLVLVAKKIYDPKRGNFPDFAFYFANQKLRDHFWRRVSLPTTKGKFTLLHMKASLVEDETRLPDEFVEFDPCFPEVVNLKMEGYSFSEIAKKLKISYPTARRRWKRYLKEIKESQIIN